MALGYGEIFWGLFFLTFHISIQGIRVPPEILCCILICMGTGNLRTAFPARGWNMAVRSAAGLLLWSLLESAVRLYSPPAASNSLFSLLAYAVGAVLRITMAYGVLSGAAERLRYYGRNAEAAEVLSSLNTWLLWAAPASALSLLPLIMGITPYLLALIPSLIVSVALLALIRRLKGLSAHTIGMPDNPDGSGAAVAGTLPETGTSGPSDNINL